MWERSLEPDLAREVQGPGTPREWKDLGGTPFLLFTYCLLVKKIPIVSSYRAPSSLLRVSPFSSCFTARRLGRPNAQPSGETTAMWDVHRYAACP
jgi:hypothetical protein